MSREEEMKITMKNEEQQRIGRKKIYDVKEEFFLRYHTIDKRCVTKESNGDRMETKGKKIRNKHMRVSATG